MAVISASNSVMPSQPPTIIFTWIGQCGFPSTRWRRRPVFTCLV